MGYYTYFELEFGYARAYPVEEGEDLCARISKWMHEDEKNCNWSHMFCIDNGTNLFCYGHEAKWYDSEKDMERLSLAFPEVEFILHGDGEESDDVWQQKWINGNFLERHQEYYWTDWS